MYKFFCFKKKNKLIKKSNIILTNCWDMKEAPHPYEIRIKLWRVKSDLNQLPPPLFFFYCKILCDGRFSTSNGCSPSMFFVRPNECQFQDLLRTVNVKDGEWDRPLYEKLAEIRKEADLFQWGATDFQPSRDGNCLHQIKKWWWLAF